MSPTFQGSDTEDRRAMSPPNARSVKTSTTSMNGKGKARSREDELDDNTDIATNESFTRAMSPEQQVRAKSPASRAVSPANGVDGQPNMVGMINGLGGRASPAPIDRTRPPADAFYNPSSPPSAANGFHHHHHSSSRNGSISNVTADLLKDLKAKEVELETVRRQMTWMREALAKASRSGYVYADRDGNEIANGDTADSNVVRYTDMILKFKQFKAQMQVRNFCLLQTPCFNVL